MFTRKLLYGADYYPEHWDKSLWKRDVALMKKAGFNLVRLAEFAWTCFEPKEGRFDFDWIDEPLDLLSAAGIQIILGTPTATVPAWLAQRYPEAMMEGDRNGHRWPFGIRKDYCYSDDDFNRISLRMVERMATHYAKDKRIWGFQTDNEFGSSRCRCQKCRGEFQEFLRGRYGSIDGLNKAWGTWFWGTRYDDFEQIDWPPEWPNPSQALDAKRFWSQVDVDYQARQIEILRRCAPGKPITHNFMGLANGVDYYKLGADLDYISWDNYPGVDTAKNYFKSALGSAVTWAAKGQNYLVMEQQVAAIGWDTYCPPTAPGETAMLAWQQVARGGDGINFFRWRTSISGIEQYWHGIINHDNVPRRRYREVAALGKTFAAVSGQIVGTRPLYEVGIYNNYDQIWATQIQKQHAQQPIMAELVMQDLAAAVAPLGADWGVFGDDSDLGGFKLLLCPPLYLSSPALVEKLSAYVRAGGNLLLTARSGVKDMSNINLMVPLPGPFAALAGVEVDEYANMDKDTHYEIELPSGRIEAQKVRELLLPAKGTQVVGVHRGAWMEGEAAITCHRLGKGKVWYVGSLPPVAAWQTILKGVLSECSCDFRTDIPEGVEIARRGAKGKTLTFVINHSADSKTLNLRKPGKDIVTGKQMEDRLELAPYGVAVLTGRG